MARPKKGTTSKAQAIRDELAKNANAKVGEVVKTLADRGIKVLSNQVYAIKAHGKAKKRKARRDAVIATGAAVGLANPVQAVTEVKVLAARIGGMKALKQLVDVLVG